MAWESLQTLGSYTLATYIGTIPSREEYVNPSLCTLGNTPLCTSVTDNPDTNHYVFNIGTDYFIDYRFRSSQQNFIDTTYITNVSGTGTYKVESCDLGFAVDHTLHEAKAMLFMYYKSSAQASTWCHLVCPEGWSTTENRQALYTILTNYHEFEWQSVPSISGKNGILQLSQIASASINNGEAVSGASASDFDSLTAQVSTLVTDDSQIAGADAGGISGSGSNSGNQSSGYAFGQGESGTDLSGGGSGYYGGEKGGSLLSGGAGSGYIGNSLVSNKKMVGYNVPTSSAEATKTESVLDVSASAVSGKPKSGNGFVRIKFLRDS